jgi:hypothetical protein
MIIQGLSVTSCLIRNDYNVFFSFCVLILLNNFYNENSYFYLKLLAHMTTAIVLVDCLWLIFVAPHWNSKADPKNAYWQSLNGVHTFTIILAFAELTVKGLLIALVVVDFRKYHPQLFSNLFNFNYSEIKVLISKI